MVEEISVEVIEEVKQEQFEEFVTEEVKDDCLSSDILFVKIKEEKDKLFEMMEHKLLYVFSRKDNLIDMIQY